MSVDSADFSPRLIELRERAPHPLARSVMFALLGLLAALVLWAVLGKLDIVAVAHGKLVPLHDVQIVQPIEQGRVSEVLVREGERVHAGQVLMRMDEVNPLADRNTLESRLRETRLAMRRVEAELGLARWGRLDDEDPVAFSRAQAQYLANRRGLEQNLAAERAREERAAFDLRAAEQTRAKLERTIAHYREQEAAYERLAGEGFVGRIQARDKTRERIEHEQDLAAQAALAEGLRASVREARHRIAATESEYHRALEAERAQLATQIEGLEQEHAKAAYRHAQFDLKAPRDGVVKDLATHTPGTVVAPGTVLMTLVPDDRLRAEVWVAQEDAGFVRPGQTVRLKLAAYEFQKYGMASGRVALLSADASETRPPQAGAPDVSTYRALVEIDSPYLRADGTRHAMTSGMRVAAEIHLGRRSVMEYLLSPIRGAFHEAGRER
jgi:HlyD family secretion protein